MTVRTMGIAAAALVAVGAASAQTGPSASGAAGTAQLQGVTATPKTSATLTPAPGAPVVGSGSGASTGEELSTTGDLAGVGGPATGAAAEGVNDPRMKPAVK